METIDAAMARFLESIYENFNGRWMKFLGKICKKVVYDEVFDGTLDIAIHQRYFTRQVISRSFL